MKVIRQADTKENEDPNEEIEDGKDEEEARSESGGGQTPPFSEKASMPMTSRSKLGNTKYAMFGMISDDMANGSDNVKAIGACTDLIGNKIWQRTNIPTSRQALYQ